MELIYTDIRKEEKGWRETTTCKKYYYNKETGDVTEVVTVDSDNPYPKGRDMDNEEVSRKILSKEEVPAFVRKRILDLMRSELKH